MLIRVGMSESLNDTFMEIKKYARINPKFDLSFVNSLEEIIWREGVMSNDQHSALLNIYFGFNVREAVKAYEEAKREA